MDTRTHLDIEDESDRKVIEDVHSYGWHVVAIPPEESTPGWLFSIGIWKSHGHPEIVVFGLDQAVAHSLINEVGRRVADGEIFNSKSEATGLIEGVNCTFRPVARKWYHPCLGTAIWYYFGSDFPVLQCIWPDHDQNYPWEPHFRASWLSAQPLLFHESPEEARTIELLATMDEAPTRAN